MDTAAAGRAALERIAAHSYDLIETADTHPARILVVYDYVVRQILTEVLAIDGQEVDTATNGREALDLIAARPYDLIMCDLRMPDLEGVGLYRELTARHPELVRRLVFLSGTTKQSWPNWRRCTSISSSPRRRL